jgi:hypothetical protein
MHAMVAPPAARRPRGTRESGERMNGRTIQFAAITVVMASMTVASLAAETHKEYHYNVGPKAGLSINNPYGSISVKPSTSNVVAINAVLASDRVEVDSSLVGNRVEIQSHLLAGADQQSGRVDYEVLVPADASVTLHSSQGTMRAEKLHGDLTLEGAAATVDVRDITDAHVHVKTLNGPVTLTNIQNGHVEVDSLSGTVTMKGVTGPLVQVISTSGAISYLGDFGDHGDIPLQPRQHTSFVLKEGSAFWGTMGRAAASSTVVLRSFSGKIHLRKRSEK